MTGCGRPGLNDCGKSERLDDKRMDGYETIDVYIMTCELLGNEGNATAVLP
jgi:hypothetical protein